MHFLYLMPICVCAGMNCPITAHCCKGGAKAGSLVCQNQMHAAAQERPSCIFRRANENQLSNIMRKCFIYQCCLGFSDWLLGWQFGLDGWRTLLTCDLGQALCPYWLTLLSSWWQLPGRDADLCPSARGYCPLQPERSSGPVACSQQHSLWNWQIFPPRDQISKINQLHYLITRLLYSPML